MAEISNEKLSGSGSQTRDTRLKTFCRDLGPRFFDLSTEDLIDYLRCALAALALFACLIVPPFSDENATLIHTILIWYFAYSLVILVARTWADKPVWPFATHLIDVGAAAFLLHLTEGSSSPCFIFFTFALVSAALRWDWRGAILTTLALLFLFIVFEFEQVDSETVLHSTYIVVGGLLLAYFGGLRAYNRERLAKLAAWPIAETVVAPTPPIEALLTRAAQVMGAPCMLLIWDTPQERKRHFSLWNQGRLECVSEVAGEPIEDLLAPCLSGNVFMTRSAKSRMVTTPRGMKFCAAPVVDPRLQSRFNMGSVVSAPFAREAAGCVGRVFALDCARAINSQLSLIEIVSDRIGLELEYHFLQLQTERSVATRERSKFAHDIHDGLLQSLTAATLQLNLSSKKCNGKIRQDLVSIQQLLTSEQKRLREFVDGRDQAVESSNVALAKWCERILSDLGKYWRCEAPLTVVPADAEIPPAMAGHLSLILAEALANAAKHGRASRVLVTLERTPEALAISINDDGGGFRGLNGTYTSEDLGSGGIGPRFLCDRVRDLNGELTLSTSLKGSSLQIRLPMAAE